MKAVLLVHTGLAIEGEWMGVVCFQSNQASLDTVREHLKKGDHM